MKGLTQMKVLGLLILIVAGIVGTVGAVNYFKSNGTVIFSSFKSTCQVARPYYGSINCELDTGSPSQPISIYNDQAWACPQGKCFVDSISFGAQDLQCPSADFGTVLSSKGLYVKVGGSVTFDQECSGYSALITTGCPSPYSSGAVTTTQYDVGASFTLHAWCNYCGISGSGVGCNNWKTPTNVGVLRAKYYPQKLDLYMDSGHGFIPNTEGCKWDNVWNQYYTAQGNTFDPLKANTPTPSTSSSLSSVLTGLIEGLKNMPSGTYTGTAQPNQLQLGQSQWIVYDWVTRPDLNIDNYNGKAVWCTLVGGSAKLVEMGEIDSSSGNCYYVPTNYLSDSIECCSSGECQAKYGTGSTCDKTTFKCTQISQGTKCTTTFDCQTLAQGCYQTGTSYFLNGYSCNNPTGGYLAGTCTQSTNQQVQCCTGTDGHQATCPTGYYCDYQKGCQKIIGPIQCPQGSCCIGTSGKYTAQSCVSGLKCCSTSDPELGNCKEQCECPTGQTLCGDGTCKTDCGGGTPPQNGGGNIALGIAILVTILLIILGIFRTYRKFKHHKRRY